MIRRGNVIYILVISFMVMILNACGSTDYIIKINNEAVTKQEFDLYLMKGKEYFEKQGGEDIWETKIDGEDAAILLKNSIVDTVTRTKIQANIAKQKNIKLDEKEEKQLNEAVKQYIGQTEKEGKYPKEVVEKFVYDNIIAVKLYNSEIENIQITDQMFSEYLKATGITDTSNISEDELKQMKEEYSVSKKSELFNKKYDEWKKDYKIEINNVELNKIDIIGK
ncbi:MAG TPA: hypothetical protein DEP72_03140 [Clostridiales bacterium]|nr:MAG: hypothetical protein A2Y18_04520 [Clostridiales bacterium GWD2_32_19]HCC07147.1 hypothetical protein [Clostridiales bacterium]